MNASTNEAFFMFTFQDLKLNLLSIEITDLQFTIALIGLSGCEILHIKNPMK